MCANIPVSDLTTDNPELSVIYCIIHLVVPHFNTSFAISIHALVYIKSSMPTTDVKMPISRRMAPVDLLAIGA